MSNAEIASLPTGWEACCFGDIAKIRNGYAFKSELFKKSKEHETDVPLIRQSQMKGARIDTSEAVFLPGEYLKKHPDFVIAKGDVIIGMSGSIGKVCLYDEDFLALQNQRTGKIIPYLVSELNPKFFGLFLSNIERKLTEYAKGMGVQNISAKDIEQLQFNLPPKNEQHRIVAKIEELFSELDKGIENLKTTRAQLKVYRQALLKHAFDGKLTVQWRKENQDKLETAAALLKRIQQERTQRYQQQLADWQTSGGSKPKAPKPLPPLTAEELAELPELPEEWGWVRIIDLIADSTLGLDRGSQYQKPEPPGFPYIKMNNVTMDGRVTADKLVFVEVDETEQERYVLREGDILFNTRNSRELVGKTGLVRKFVMSTVYNNNLMRIRLYDEVSPYFVCHQMCSPGFKKKLEAAKKGTTNVAAVYAKDLFPLLLVLAPQLEQQRIVEIIEARLSEVDQLDQIITTSLQQAEALRQSILKKAFSGQLVPQDPHDEPASALLARIRAERAVGAKNAHAAAKPHKTAGKKA